MNKAYRLIWNRAKEVWIVAAETVKGKGGPPPLTIAAMVTATSLLLAPVPAHALPTAPQVINGTANISTSGSAMTITNSANAIINWQGFSIGQNESARFIQLSALSAVLNRVTGGDPSKILGALQSNGKVLLINQNGILFGPNSRIEVNGLVASTLDITNQDFLAGRMKFSAGPVAGKVENQGTITTPGGGLVYLIAQDITNSGVITAPNGDIMLAAGKEVMLVDSRSPEIAIVVSAPEHQAINLGTLVADAGRIGVYGGIVKQKGIISANSAVMEGGKIFLKATKSIELADSSVISADGTKGGQISVKTEDDVKLSGTLTAWGTISAQGDGTKGSGGFVETSAAKVDLNGINVLTNGGNWLIDPIDFTIAAGTGVQTSSGIGATTLSTALGSGSVFIATDSSTLGNGDISVNSALNWSANTTLTLAAHRHVNVNANITSSGATGNLTLVSGWDGNSATPHSTGTTGNIIIDSKLISTKGNILAEAAGSISIAATLAGAPLSSGINVGGGNGILTLLANNGPVSITAGSGGTALSTARAATVINNGTGVTSITGTSITITGGSYSVVGSLASISTSGNLTVTSTDNVAGNVTLTGGTTGKSGAIASITSGGDLSINATSLILNKGTADAKIINNGSAKTINLTADKMALSGTITGGSSEVTLSNKTLTNAINLGSGVDTTANTLELSATELLAITTTGGLTIGSANNTGAITVSAPVATTNATVVGTTLINKTGGIVINNVLTSGAGASALNLTADGGTGAVGTISDAAGTTGVVSGLLTIKSNGGISLTGSGNAVTSFNATNTSGNIALTNSAASLTITGVNQSGGGVTVSNTGVIAITGTIAAAASGAVNLTALGASGSITQSGVGLINTTGTLTTSSVSGQTLSGANTVGTFNATNTTSGNIHFVNTADSLTITGLTQSGSDTVALTNSGGFTTTGPIVLAGGATTFTATGSTGDITLGGTITKSGTDSALTLNAGRNMDVNQSITSSTGKLKLTLNPNLSAGGGTSTIASGKTVNTNYGNLTFNSGLTANGTLKNGTLISGDTTAISGTSSFDNMTIGTNLTKSGDLDIYNNLTLVDGITLNTTGSFPTVRFMTNGPQSVSTPGNATWYISNGSLYAGANAAQTLTLGTGLTLSGYGSLTKSFVGTTITNNGTILANTSNNSWSIDPTTFNNTGMVQTTLGNITISPLTSFSNTGSLLVGSGTTITNAGPGTFTQSGTIDVGSGGIFTRTAGFTNTGILSGCGTIVVGTSAAKLINQGTIKPGGYATAGTLSITGDLLLDTGSNLNIELGGTTANQYDKLAVTGNFTMGGAMNASLLVGYTPAEGDFIPFLTMGGTASGAFATISPPFGFVAGYNLASDEATRLIYSVASNSFSNADPINPLTWESPSNWSLGTVPVSTQSVLISSGYAVTHTTGADSVAALTINSNNSLNVSGGSLTVLGTTTLGGSLAVSGTGVATLAGSLNGGTTGQVNVSGGSLLLNGTSTVKNFTISGGTLGGSGQFTVANNYTHSSGTVDRTGAMNITQTTGDLTFSATKVGALELVAAAGNISIGNVNATTGNVSAPAGSIYLNASVVGTTIAFLSANSIIQESGGLNASSLGFKAGGAVTLSSDTNMIDAIAGSTSAMGINVNNSKSLAIGTLVASAYSVTGLSSPTAVTINLAVGGITDGVATDPAIVTPILNITSQTGIGTGFGTTGTPLKTQVSSLSATNNGTSGDINIHNTGVLTTAGWISNGNPSNTTGGNITIVAKSPLTIGGSGGSGGVSALNQIWLEAGASGAGVTTDNLTISGNVISATNKAVALRAGNSIIENGTITGMVTRFPNLNLPILVDCIANAALTGCSSVLPSIAVCTSAPTTEGCTVVLPSLATCTTTPTAPGCTAVLPTLSACTTTPTAPGCTAVLPNLATCITTPTAPGCTAVLPTLSACTTTPTASGCTAVLPNLATCATAPTTAGCTAVLPTLVTCITTPTAPGCTAVLPTLSACTTTPTASGCTAVLPNLATCATAPTTAGCTAVLPTLVTCITTPTAPGCTAVLPTLSACTTTPTALGCTAVLPTLAACITNLAAPGCTVVLPTVDTCTTTPTMPGCSTVLPTLLTCITNPTALGCSAVLPSVDICTGNSNLPGCVAVLPTLAACINNPASLGCSAVLPTVATCTTNPAATGCTAVLPTLVTCITSPTAPGCTSVLPTLVACITSPTAPGCTAVLPSVAICTTSPTTSGCTAVLPTAVACVTSPSTPGCSAVLLDTTAIMTEIALAIAPTVNQIAKDIALAETTPVALVGLILSVLSNTNEEPSSEPSTEKEKEKGKEKKTSSKDKKDAKPKINYCN